MSAPQENAHRTAIVTGATGGIGSAIARRLCREGVHVFATGRDASRTRDVAATIEAEEGAASGGRCTGVELDVVTGASVESMVEIIGASTDAPIDWVVNNAGVAETSPATSPGNQGLLRRLMEVNLYGALRLFHAYSPGMLERRSGAVVQIASSASLVGYPYVSAYAASKHALLGWTRAAALECAPKGVAVSAVCPHYVDTPLTDRSIQKMQQKSGRSEEDLRGFIASQNPGGVIVTPEEVADATFELLTADHGGIVVELPGGSSKRVEHGVRLATDTGEAA